MKDTKKSSFAKPELSTEDLTKALYHITKELDASNALLRKTQQQKDLLLANISHDLRSPVTAIRNSIDYLLSLEEPTKEEITDTLSLIRRRSVYLETLINDVFLLSSIEVNDALFHMEKVNLTYILEDFYFTTLEDNRYKDRTLSLKVAPDLEALVSVDTKMFVRVLDNLFTNALKYSYKDASITLGAFLEKQMVHIYVEDTGIGIEPEHLEHIFEASYMVESARTPKESTGTGLGLSIAKAIICQFHGSIWCESTPQMGSTFHITLPLT